jgi:hypothetical protein
MQRDQKTKKYWDSPEFRCSVPHNPSRKKSLHTLFKLITRKKEMYRSVNVPLIRGPKSSFRYTEKKPFKPTNLTHSPHVCWFPKRHSSYSPFLATWRKDKDWIIIWVPRNYELEGVWDVKLDTSKACALNRDVSGSKTQLEYAFQSDSAVRPVKVTFCAFRWHTVWLSYCNFRIANVVTYRFIGKSAGHVLWLEIKSQFLVFNVFLLEVFMCAKRQFGSFYLNIF